MIFKKLIHIKNHQICIWDVYNFQLAIVWGPSGLFALGDNDMDFLCCQKWVAWCVIFHTWQQKYITQESIPVGCIPPTCQPYMLWWPPDVNTMWGGSVQWDQRNKFAQVFSDGHQMSLAGGSPVSDVWRGIICLEGELNLGPGVSCKMRSRASGIMVTWDPPAPFVDR